MGKTPARWLVESDCGGRHSHPLPLSILSAPSQFRRYSRWRNLIFIVRLWLSLVELPAGCWRCRPFSWSRSFLLDAVETPGTSAGRQRCPWHTPEVIPTTLALKLGKSHRRAWGFGGFLSSPKSCSFLSKSQDPSSGLEVTNLEVKSHGASPAISGRASSNTDPAGDRHATASRCVAPWNLCHFGFCSHAVTSTAQQCLVLSF
jgi:hypothetical protein